VKGLSLEARRRAAVQRDRRFVVSGLTLEEVFQVLGDDSHTLAKLLALELGQTARVRVCSRVVRTL
jgi:hypothetical protein